METPDLGYLSPPWEIVREIPFGGVVTLQVTTSNGLVLQVGMGLSNGLLKDAKEFLSNPNSPEAMKPPPYREPPIETWSQTWMFLGDRFMYVFSKGG